jgi:hypothetical protein
VDVAVIAPAICQPMNQRGIAVKGEYNWTVGREYLVEVFIG